MLYTNKASRRWTGNSPARSSALRSGPRGFYTSDGETRQEYEVILLGRPVSGEPRANNEASAAAWFTVAELDGLDIDPTQWRQLRDWIDGSTPHIDEPRRATSREPGPLLFRCGLRRDSSSVYPQADDDEGS